MKAISTLDTLIRPEIPDAPDFIIERHALRVLRDFCAVTHIWQETLVAVTASEGDEDCELEPDYGEAHAVLSIDVDSYDPDKITFSPPSTLVFDAALEDDISMDVKVALKPGLTDTTVPDWLIEKYEVYLVAGVLARMMLQMNQSWSNPQLSAVYANQYRSGIAKANAHRLKEHAFKNLRVAQRAWI